MTGMLLSPRAVTLSAVFFCTTGNEW